MWRIMSFLLLLGSAMGSANLIEDQLTCKDNVTSEIRRLAEDIATNAVETWRELFRINQTISHRIANISNRVQGLNSLLNTTGISLSDTINSVENNVLSLKRKVLEISDKVTRGISTLTNSQQSMQQLLLETKSNLNALEASLSHKVCPLGWARYKSSCYFVNLRRMNWTQAESFCDSLSSHLVEIDSEEENRFVYSLLVDSGYAMAYIGLNGLQRGGLVWRGGRAAAFTRWDADEPSNSGGIEQCVQMYGFTNAEQCRTIGDWFVQYCQARLHNVGFWNDIPCDLPRDSVCEKQIFRSM